MKFFTLLLITFFFANSAMATQDTIPNPGFEYWTFQGSYYDPNDWTCLNPYTTALSVYTANRDSTIVHSGKYSIKLTTKSVGGQTAPGLVTTGTVNVSSGNITGGIPISSRPVSLSGWYQYIPVGHDSAGFSITLTQWDVVGDSEIVVGVGNVFAGSKDTVWTEFTVAVQYLSNATPDTVLLLFSSGVSVTPQINSTLWLDDLSYSYNPLGIAEVVNNAITVYPNPASQQINIDNQAMQASNLNMYTADGKFIKLVKMHEGMNNVDVSTLSAGFYILSGIGADGIAYHSSVVIDK